MKTYKLSNQRLPKSVEEHIEKQTQCVTEMRSPEYHSNCGLLYNARQRIQGLYLSSPAGIQYQYDLLMTTLRKMVAILDDPDLYCDEASQNRALALVDALEATFPDDARRLVLRHSGAPVAPLALMGAITALLKFCNGMSASDFVYPSLSSTPIVCSSEIRSCDASW